ncbi:MULTISPECIES: hypothetical protein [unclassified Psychrobacter]|uniref:hypothetical protein n=1 Tax=unclassified Psychrobacter TaxID=196806 RepID=UPI00071E8CFC|nr:MULTISPECIES: hypothetical protein [unclassified Psychrobacter]OLF39391.1 hypothetical protein BTV98_03065 [Psychrobacter sp. Cmf 22.2]
MDIILVIVWILAMILYSFSSDYAVSFPNHHYRALPFVRWGSLLIAMVLSGYLAQAYQDNLQGNGIWVFIVVVFVIITLAKLVFKWVINRRR